MQTFPKRPFRPVASTPSTAEYYGDKFGIPDDVQSALQNVGRKGRMAVTQGRTFERTQTMPNLLPTFDHKTREPTFITDSEARVRAQEAIYKEDLRRRELQPYSNTLDETVPRVRGSSPALGDDLGFRDDMEWEENQATRKRRASAEPEEAEAEEEEEEDEGEATDVDDEEPCAPKGSNDHSSLRSSLPTASMSHLDEFPPVFTSPRISQPELFASFTRLSGSSDARPTRGLPRMLGKTMSAPVGHLGQLARPGGSGMQVDETEDGFDVTEWAANEEF